MAYEPDKDEVLLERAVPGTDIIIQIRAYNGGEAKVAISRVVERRDGTIITPAAGRLSLAEAGKVVVEITELLRKRAS